MCDRSVDVLMITYDSPEYVRRSLPRLLESCDDEARVWLWHNGDHEETLEATRSFIDDPRVHRFHHSRENLKLRAPTNWLWENATGGFVGKVDDDCLLEPGWIHTLREAHLAYPRFGVLGAWRFPDEDYVPELADRKIESFPGGHRVLRNFWVQGSGYLMKRVCTVELGPLAAQQSFPQYCIELSLRGWVNGWYYPFVHEDHMDDPRSPNTSLRTDADLARRLPLTARRNGVETIDAWTEQLRRSARASLAAPLDPRYFVGWRKKRRRLYKRTRRLVGIRREW